MDAIAGQPRKACGPAMTGRRTLVGLALLPAAARAQPWQLDAPGGTLHGTLTLPPGEGRVPAALLLAGSGPTGRDGDQAGARHAALRRLAEGLAEAGIATLRADKRGVGESAAAAPDEAAMRPETLVADAALWAARLARHPRVAHVAVIGHSEGGLLGMLLAPRIGARALVLLAAPGRPLGDILRAQLPAALPPAPLAEALAILARLEAQEAVAEVPPALAPLFRPSVQPYLREALALDPVALLARVTAPVLVGQGGRDLQVSLDDARRLAAARPGAQLHLLPHMNHVLRDAPADRAGNLALYTQVDAPLAPGLVATIAAFLHAAA